MTDQVRLPRVFVQNTGAEINMQSSRLQKIVKTWMDAAVESRAGDTESVLKAIDGTTMLLTGMREQIVMEVEKETKRVTAQATDTP